VLTVEKEFVRSMFGAPLVIWAQSFCRSTLATYLEAKRHYPGEAHIVIHGDADPDFRAAFGFRSSEFDLSLILAINPSIDEARDILKAYRHGIHMFTAYHKSAYNGSKFFNDLIDIAISDRITYFIGSEAPLNMEGGWIRFLAKEFYLRFMLRLQLARTVQSSNFMLSYSGQDVTKLVRAGWQMSKIVPFGYYPPPLQVAYENSPSSSTDASIDYFVGNEALTILLSGEHSTHKSPLTAIAAFELLCADGYADKVRLLVTGHGTQTEDMKRLVSDSELPVDFFGFVDLGRLITMIRNCDVFLATGIREPWGIRVNDALNLGCPAIVSSGMGAVDLVRGTGCGWVFDAGDARSLADVIARLVERREEVVSASAKAASSEFLSPSYQGRRLVDFVRGRMTKV
jgi:glycosyltransferase involved in cell wall biosynthesis